MSANTWTPTALASEFAAWQGAGWRAVEAQHKVATMGLVRGDVGAQAILEGILEDAKPTLPPAAAGLHWLLATPFRYRPLPGGSRFRRRQDSGVFYGAEERETACAEAGYWRLRFWNESAFLGRQAKSITLTLFEFHAATARALDLTRPPLDAGRALWTHPADYAATQALAENACSESSCMSLNVRSNRDGSSAWSRTPRARARSRAAACAEGSTFASGSNRLS